MLFVIRHHSELDPWTRHVLPVEVAEKFVCCEAAKPTAQPGRVTRGSAIVVEKKAVRFERRDGEKGEEAPRERGPRPAGCRKRGCPLARPRLGSTRPAVRGWKRKKKKPAPSRVPTRTTPASDGSRRPPHRILRHGRTPKKMSPRKKRRKCCLERESA